MSKPDVLNDMYYIPANANRDEGARLAASWLHEQDGTPLVLFPAANCYDNDALLARLTRGTTRATPRNLFSSSWRRGPVLAPWPTQAVLELLTDRLSSRVTSLCVIEWGEPSWQCNWLTAQKARSLVDGHVHGGGTVTLDPVVEVAMQFLAQRVNHGNGLVGIFDKRDAIETLEVLHRAGYYCDIEKLCTWALANGFTYSEVEQLREYARGVQQGRRFRLQAGRALRPDIIELWKAEAAGDSNSVECPSE